MKTTRVIQHITYIIIYSQIVLPQTTPETTTHNCPGQLRPSMDTLSNLISIGRGLIPQNSQPICIMEVGTGDGMGTTVSLFNTMLTLCRNESNHREFNIYTYEGLPILAERAAKNWKGEQRVTVINELAILNDTIQKHILPEVMSLQDLEFPGRRFYINFYNNHNNKVAKGIYGKYFSTLPNCTLDIVLLDGARFSHTGVIHTLLSQPNLTTSDTVYIAENDYWTQPYNGSQLDILARTWNVTNIHKDEPKGQMWPWMVFRLRQQ